MSRQMPESSRWLLSGSQLPFIQSSTGNEMPCASREVFHQPMGQVKPFNQSQRDRRLEGSEGASRKRSIEKTRRKLSATSDALLFFWQLCISTVSERLKLSIAVISRKFLFLCLRLFVTKRRGLLARVSHRKRERKGK